MSWSEPCNHACQCETYAILASEFVNPIHSIFINDCKLYAGIREEIKYKDSLKELNTFSANLRL
jgi:hypothetical protein